MSGLKIINANIIEPDGIFFGEVSLCQGKIAYAGERQKHTDSQYRLLDANSLYLAPGFIDIHVHGGGGSDFMDAAPDAFETAARTHAAHGTTTLYPTTVACPDETLFACMDAFTAIDPKQAVADLPGLHLEGPYLAPTQKGAIDERYILLPRKEHYNKVMERAELIKRWSIAPEIEGALALAVSLKKRGIVVSIAHTEAVYEEVVRAVGSGFSLVTHLYSAMSGLRRINGYRKLGVIESAYLMEALDVEIIADGHHLPAELLRLIVKNIDQNRIALITDAMRAAGTDCHESVLGAKTGGLSVIIEDGVAKLPDRSAFAGSVSTADVLVRNMVQLAGVSLPDAVAMITLNPARIMGLTDRGVVKEGYKADLVLFDEQIQICKVIKDGKVVSF